MANGGRRINNIPVRLGNQTLVPTKASNSEVWELWCQQNRTKYSYHYGITPSLLPGVLSWESTFLLISSILHHYHLCCQSFDLVYFKAIACRYCSPNKSHCLWLVWFWAANSPEWYQILELHCQFMEKLDCFCLAPVSCMQIRTTEFKFSSLFMYFGYLWSKCGKVMLVAQAVEQGVWLWTSSSTALSRGWKKAILLTWSD